DARPEHPSSDDRERAALQMNHARAGVIHRTMTKAEAIADLSQPAAAPDPVAEDGVGESTHENAENEETLEAPALGTGTSDDGRGGVHERHHEQEHHDRGRVVAGAGQQEPGGAKQTPAVVTIDGSADGEHL